MKFIRKTFFLRTFIQNICQVLLGIIYILIGDILSSN